MGWGCVLGLWGVVVTNSRAKGCRGELEAAALLRQYGFEARRGQQFSGSPDSPDIKHSIPGVHIEVKRVEHLSLYKAMEQAEGDAPEGSMPVVMHRRNRKPWVVVLKAEDFLRLVRPCCPGCDGGPGFGLGL